MPTKEQIAAFDAAREAQDRYWNALSDLEAELGFDLDGADDLATMSLEELIKANEEEDS